MRALTYPQLTTNRVYEISESKYPVNPLFPVRLQERACMGNRSIVVVGCRSSTAQDHVTVRIAQGDKNG